MDKDELQVHIDYFNTQLNNYHPAYINFRNGKNKSIRDKGERQVDNILLMTTNYLNNNDDLHQMFMAFFKGFAYGEALSWRYFHRDIPRFIEHLENTLSE